MIFSSIEFLLFFLPVFMLVYALTPRKAKNVTLLSGSLVFYALGEPKYLVLLMLSVLVNYFFGLHMGQGAQQQGEKYQYKPKHHKKRQRIFAAALLFNVGLLAAFKAGAEGAGLPLGISFYTFQILSYLADVYRGEQKREMNFIMLATYITMFPQLLSGPIVRYGEVEGALREREFTARGVQEGMTCFTVGLVAKVLLADRIGLLWHEVQTVGFESISTQLAWLAAAAYSMKIYFDFMGYSLMAMGLGRMLGFELPENFRDPYMALSVRDFYRRWHMTLGQWFRQYVYIPLGGNRKGELRTVCNLLAVWVLTAVWHGCTPNFLIWGALLWAAIVAERLLAALGRAVVNAQGRGKAEEKQDGQTPAESQEECAGGQGKVAGKLLGAGKWCGRLVLHLLVWAFIPVTWMCFANTDLGELRIFLGRMFGTLPGVQISAADWRNALVHYGALFGAGAFACTSWVRRIGCRWKDTLPGMLVLAALFWLCVWRIRVEGNNPFMYLDF